MGLMGSLYVGVSGLRVGQNGLNATAHNLANVDTIGFTRQQTVLRNASSITVGQSHFSSMQVGLGADTEAVLQVRDAFLDKSYRQEFGRQGFYDAQYEAVYEIENLFGELEGVAFQDSIEKFWVSMQELSKEPESIVTRGTFIQTAVSLTERSEKIFKQVQEYQLSLNKSILEKVDRINEIGDEIKKLNGEISKYESNGIENANDLRDQRNNLLDELGQLTSISYKESLDGKVSVIVEGVSFVTEDQVFHMGTMTIGELDELARRGEEEEEGNKGLANANAGMLVPVWPKYGDVEVFSFERLPSTEDNTDIGSLKGLILARGNKIGKYFDIPAKPSESDYIDEFDELDEEAYKADMDVYNDQVKEYNRTIEPSVIMSMQAQFDQLVHGLATMVNDILSPNKEVTIAAGTTVILSNGESYTYEEDTKIKIFDSENAPVGMDGPPPSEGIELFSRKSMPRYMEEQEITLEDGTIITARIYNKEDPNDNYSLYTLGEITINQELLENKSKLPLSVKGGTGDYDIGAVEKLITAWQSPFATLTPNTLTMNNFNNYYNSFIGNMATKGEMLNAIAENQASMANSLNSKRLEVAGVSSDEELTNMIKFQHAYNAASRYVNVIDEMLEHIITRL